MYSMIRLETVYLSLQYLNTICEVCKIAKNLIPKVCGLLLPRSGFDPGKLSFGFMTNKMTVRQVFPGFLYFIVFNHDTSSLRTS